MSALSSTFAMEARGSDAFIDAEAGLDSTISNPLYNTKPVIDPMQTIRQVAQPHQDSANQPNMSAEQAKAMQQREQLTSKGPGGVGSALGAGDKGGAARQETAQKEATKLATEVAKLDKKIAGGDQPQATATNSFARAAAGQAVPALAAVGATMVAGPVAGAAVAVASTAYDVAAVFSGRSGGGSSFKSSADSTGYVASAAPAQPAAQAAPVSTAFMQGMMNIPGERKIGGGDIENVTAGLNGITKAPPLEMTPAAVAIAGIYKNGADARRSNGESPEADKDDKLDFKPAALKPGNPGVFVPPKPMAFV